MYKVALTGGIATGKSTVATEIRLAGFPVIDTDQLARQVVTPESPGLKQIVERFGAGILSESGQLDRVQLGQLVFQDKGAMEDLNQILHPYIQVALFEEWDRLDKLGHLLIFVEVPLLYEAGWEVLFDEVWVVYAPFNIQVERLMRRDSLNQAGAIQRINYQLPTSEKAMRADRVIDSQFGLTTVKEQVNQALQALKNKL